MNVAITSHDLRLLDRAVDAACEELDIEIQTLDVPTRDRLVQRILALLTAEK